ncbi:MAG TPA: hypothetical protein VMU81_06225 [Acetobacteraceae bacterium]|nr:hypothetical protein [Acetobacteraceae bacterium]
MKTCIAVCDLETGTQLAFLSGIELYKMLDTMTVVMFEKREAPLGDGKIGNPYIIDSFKKILGYIYLRDANPRGRLYFTFFGQKMYQNGNDAQDPEKPYYLGVDGSATLSYPAMARSLANPSAAVATAPNVKQAVGVLPQNANELLAIAALFIAEGRRSRPSIVTHLLLCDLITDQVTYGTGGKLRSLSKTLDKASGNQNFLTTYRGLTAAGDSPMSQNDAVDQFKKTNMSIQSGAMVSQSRYFDKTVSLVVQWVVNYFVSSNYEMTACDPGDDVSSASSAIAKKIETHIAETLETARTELRGKSTPSAFKNKWPKERSKVESAARSKLDGLQPMILAQVNNMLKAKFDKAIAGDASGFTFDAGRIDFDPKVLVKVLSVV